ncbi:hypothetical protein ACNKFQ_04055 [Klebsiella quasipneumoniae]|uniref:hypothetical protein n=1 Tax=Klebsiella quasipneumoniae TaxID=1463165 RepID=UPI003740A45D|nr:hypothetical protein [Klebsiella pneumoniae]HBT0312340.1 hypothetical protein [Klebsiella pneumoniae]HCB0896048.1 hypothetical protein [Klebsiella variicola subsp. variicola]HCB4010991.1 hypothetical protein [Klebsiella variicola subsp. variicola]
MTESIWKAKGIAELKYCKVERAAELLNCQLEDIIHWAYTKKIQICIRIYDLPCKLLFPSLSLSEHGSVLSFLVELIKSPKPHEIIENYFPSYDRSLISIYPAAIFDFHCDDDIDKVNQILEGQGGYPFRVDGLWGVESSYFGYEYSSDFPPVLGSSLSEDYIMMAKALDALNISAPPSAKEIFLNTSFSLYSPDGDEWGDFKAMVGVLDRPVTLAVDNLFLTKKQIEKIYLSSIRGGWEDEGIKIENKNSKIAPIQSEYPELENKKIRITSKQSKFTVSLMKKLGFSDKDFTGSITSLRMKIAKVIPEAEVPDDDKSLIEWLRKGGVKR